MKNFRILIVEDNRIFREGVKESLRTSFPTGTVDEAVDGREVLKKVGSFHPDFILMDINLPGENGLELTKEIKATHPNIIIFILTNYDIPEYREAAFQFGADRFLGKSSLNSSELEQLVRAYAGA